MRRSFLLALACCGICGAALVSVNMPRRMPISAATTMASTAEPGLLSAVLGLAAFVLGAAAIGFAVAWVRTREKLIRAQSGEINDGNVAERLGRVEHAIDAVALEVERIGEMERFSAKLLAARQEDAERVGSLLRPQEGRVITPH